MLRYAYYSSCTRVVLPFVSMSVSGTIIVMLVASPAMAYHANRVAVCATMVKIVFSCFRLPYRLWLILQAKHQRPGPSRAGVADGLKAGAGSAAYTTPAARNPERIP